MRHEPCSKPLSFLALMSTLVLASGLATASGGSWDFASATSANFVIGTTLMGLPTGTQPPRGYVNQPYSFSLQSSFGTAPYTYQIERVGQTFVGSLPPGLALDESGNITGTPTTPGRFAFEVLITDSSRPPQQRRLPIALDVSVAVTTWHNDNSRSGANTSETILTPANVNAQTFGKRMVFPVQGWVVAQPLYVPGVNIKGTLHNVVYIATEHDQVYAFDVDSGQMLWQKNFLSPPPPGIVINTVSSQELNCDDIAEIGVSATPAIDTSTGTMYVVAKTKQIDLQSGQVTYHQALHALDMTTGRNKVEPRQIVASVPGNGTGSVGGVLNFDPFITAQRPALLLYDKGVIAAFGSHCDLYAYHGWLMGFNKRSLTRRGVMADTPNGYEGGFWGGGSGPAADSSGSIYVATANGYFDADKDGIDYGDTVLRLNWDFDDRAFTVMDYFTPWDQLTLDQKDRDLGSGGVLLLPDQPGTQYPHLLVQAGKEGTIDLVNRDNMGHFHSGDDSQIVQTIPSAVGSIWGGPAFWNNNIYFGPKNDHLKAFSFDPIAQRISLTYTSRSPESFLRPGPTPSVSANGATNGIVWISETDTYVGGGAAVLRAYDATNLANELYNSNQNPGRDAAGVAVEMAIPTIVDGHVFVGAQNEVDMYGLLQ
jgi:outer membrane protein assembly factor BamB